MRKFLKQRFTLPFLFMATILLLFFVFNNNAMAESGVTDAYGSTLSSDITAATTTIPVTSFTLFSGEKVSSTSIHFPVYVLISPTSYTNREKAECWGINDALLKFTDCVRGMSALPGNTTSTVAGGAKAHVLGEPVIISTDSYFFNRFVDNWTLQSIGGVKNFTSGITWASATGTNVTSTNLYATNLIFGGATGTSLFSTTLGGTGLYFTNGVFSNASGTTLSLTGDFSSGSSTITSFNFTNATGTSIYASVGLFGTISGSTLTSTNISWTNATGTNATSTNLYVTNFGFVGATGTGLSITGTFQAASTTVTTLNFTDATGSSVYASTIRSATLCLTGDTCITSWPVASTGFSWSALEFPPTNDTYSLGSATGSLANIYASGTLSTLYGINWTYATGTNLWFTNATGTNSTATTGIFTNLCLTGDDCITTWPSGTGSGEIPQLTQVLNTGRSATTTPTFDMGFTATSGTITNATATNFDVTTRLGWLDATGTSLFATSGGFTSLYTGAFTANGTGATSTNLYISGNSIVTSLQWTNATGTTLALTGNFSAGSSTVTTLNFTNATGTAIYASSYTGSTITVTSATMTNLGVTSLLVGGKLPCLADGTNCPFASIAETSTGTETAKAITPDSLAGSNYGKRFIELQMATDTKAYLATSAATSCQMIPPELNGWYLVDAWATNNTVGAGGTSTQIQIVRATSTDAVVWTYSDMLSRPIHIDPPEIGSWAAMATTTPAINASNKTVTAYEMICAEIKALTNTPPKGTVTAITLQAP